MIPHGGYEALFPHATEHARNVISGCEGYVDGLVCTLIQLAVRNSAVPPLAFGGHLTTGKVLHHHMTSSQPRMVTDWMRGAPSQMDLVSVFSAGIMLHKQTQRMHLVGSLLMCINHERFVRVTKVSVKGEATIRLINEENHPIPGEIDIDHEELVNLL